jgi:hypothetical protein
LALLRTLEALLLMEDEEDRLRTPGDDSLDPIFGLLRQALARHRPVERLFLDERSTGSRRLAELARVNSEGLVILLVPRLAPFLSLEERQRKSWPPRLVNLEPSIPVELPAAGFDGQPVLFAGFAALVIVDRRGAVIGVRVPSVAVAPASLAAARNHRWSISTPFFIAQPSKSSVWAFAAAAGGAVATSSRRNSGAIDTLM